MSNVGGDLPKEPPSQFDEPSDNPLSTLWAGHVEPGQMEWEPKHSRKALLASCGTASGIAWVFHLTWDLCVSES